MHFELWQWVLAVIGALLVGVSKTGIAGLGMLFVVIFAQIMPAKQATGVVLPLLIFGDIIAVASYRQHTQWRFLWRLFPWTAIGVVIGFVALGRIDDRQAQVMIGLIVLSLLALHVGRRVIKPKAAGIKPQNVAASVTARSAPRSGAATGQNDTSVWRAGSPDPAAKTVITAGSGDPAVQPQEASHGWWFAPTIGVLAGFTTLVANAAGPLMVIYLLAMRLPKMEFVGTGAVFFLLLNLFKVPFMVNLGLINGGSFALNLWLAPAVFLGAWIGRKILLRINQRLFENLALALSAAAGVKLLC
ncbi:sulfite exporter TauE/SafE family protein [Opitutus terrae]|uniref:Probable membrane transporter protein n=1 Tax=Opitutus terrae (strain DSM 11246 / JCM 15787 / PB90-1) TaxID=452637 RepID=B1ZSD4_OPITP|nr:sulfite exporter TauE/SafE family protein [Opitutus terrae]ACB75733.1 protein of unknown function DUF81 [Opitutus terrae PB90-1]